MTTNNNNNNRNSYNSIIENERFSSKIKSLWQRRCRRRALLLLQKHMQLQQNQQTTRQLKETPSIHTYTHTHTLYSKIDFLSESSND
jgi:hypothetical protein